ncbi:Nitroreductase [Thiohalospira halophila DSM 15071]|uniref:Nitroreductase n=1 Tax=Thiohalospira halophila DSM 15071 TaxID=1123397 RepID=A0A1I1QX85_9GAMM|nr:nitroreductase family protein [Thiohalospira halophila]SFD26645.1 Nitroreductase [Thiohalospira halophila DSM 15071]
MSNESSANGLTVSEAMQTRRAVKSFDPEFRIPEAEVQGMLEAAIQSPTAFNIQNWRIVRVTDADLRASIRAVAWDQAQVTDASELFILCADNSAWDRDPERYWVDAPQQVQEIIVPNIRKYYQGRPMVAQDEGQRSCGMLGMSLMLLARERGYDSCPMDGFDYSAVAELIGLPADHAIAFMVAVGKRAGEPFNKPGQLPLTDVVRENGF